MKLKILGTGTCVPSLKRSAPSNYLRIDNKQILIDCGSGTLIQLEKARLTYREIDIIFISHYHSDHISDLNALIQALNHTPNFVRKKDLIIVGAAGFIEFYEKYIKTISGIFESNKYKIIVKEIKDKLKFDGFNVECCKTKHTDVSLAYKFIEGNKSLVISGDTDFDKNLIVFSKNCNVLVLECSYDNSGKVKGHLIPKECGRIAKKANVGKLILTHLYPTSPERVRLNETKEIFKNTILAEDLMDVKI